MARLASPSDAKLTSASPLGLQSIKHYTSDFALKLKQVSPPVVVEMDNHVHRIRHRAEPLRDLILRDPEGEPPHVDTEHAASAPRASAHAAPHVGPRAAWESSKEII